MGDNTYKMENLVFSYRKLGHGKARAAAIRCAIEQADLNNDIPYMVFLREELCSESLWYLNGLDVITIFPEILALIDRYPDVSLTRFQKGEPDIIKPVLWLYEALLSVCSDFYQVSLGDGIKFCNDFLKRWTAYGHDAKEPYRIITEFYMSTGDMDSAGIYFNKFKQCGGTECYCEPSCAANTDIRYYLLDNEKEKADKIAEDILNYKIKSYSLETNAMMRMESTYMRYYILHGDYAKAAECAHILEYSNIETSEFKQWMAFMCAYVHENPGHALHIYKKYYKEWHKEDNPFLKYYTFMNTACFFKGITKEKRTGTVHIGQNVYLPPEAVAGREGVYNINILAEYYYNEAFGIAQRFDSRNGTNKFTDELYMSFENVL